MPDEKNVRGGPKGSPNVSHNDIDKNDIKDSSSNNKSDSGAHDSDNEAKGIKDLMSNASGDDNEPKGIKGLMSNDSGDDKSKSKGSQPKNDLSKFGKKLNNINPLKSPKLLKRSAQASGLTSGAVAAYVGYKIAQLIAFFKMLLAKGIAAIQGIMATIMSIINTVISVVSTVLSVGTAVAATITFSGAASIVAITAISISGIISNSSARTDALSNACVPSVVKVDEAASNPVESNAQRTDSITKAWSVLKAAGANEKTAGAILGNWDVESGVDPTGVETIMDEGYTIGPRKKEAQAAGFKVSAIAPAYGSKYPSIDLVGIGLGQWTNGRNTMLMDYAKSKNKNWYDISTQLGFMLSSDDPSRVATFKSLVDNQNISVNDATEQFLVKWEGNAGNKLPERQTAAGQLAVQLKDLKADESYGESILNDANVDKGSDNHTTGEKNKSDGCDSTVGSHYSNSNSNSKIVDAGRKYLNWFYYVQDHSLGAFGDWDDPSKSAGTDCSGFIWFVLHKVGSYKMPENMQWYTGSMEDDAKGKHQWLQEIPAKEAKAGDIVIINTGSGAGNDGHTGFLTEDWHGNDTKIIEQGGMGRSVNEAKYGDAVMSLLATSHTETFARPIQK